MRETKGVVAGGAGFPCGHIDQPAGRVMVIIHKNRLGNRDEGPQFGKGHLIKVRIDAGVGIKLRQCQRIGSHRDGSGAIGALADRPAARDVHPALPYALSQSLIVGVLCEGHKGGEGKGIVPQGQGTHRIHNAVHPGLGIVVVIQHHRNNAVIIRKLGYRQLIKDNCISGIQKAHAQRVLTHRNRP